MSHPHFTSCRAGSWSRPAVSHPPFLPSRSLSIPAASAADNGSVAGSIVDPSGRPIPRAHVRVLDAAGHETAATFTDDAGHFSSGGVRQLPRRGHAHRIRAGTHRLRLNTAPTSC